MNRSRQTLDGSKRVRRMGVVVLAAVVVGLVGGCGSSSKSNSGQSSTTGAAAVSQPSKGGGLIGETSPVASNYSLHAITVGASKVAQGLGWGYKMLDANLSPTKQVSDIDTLISQKAKGIITQTLDPGAANAAYKRARAAGVLLVGIDVPSPYFQTEVAQETDTTCAPGQDAAAYIASRVPHAKVLVVGGPPAPQVLLRTKCFTDAAKAHGLNVAETQYNTNDSESAAEPIVHGMFTKHPDAQAIFAYNDPSGLAASTVVREAGKQIWSGHAKGVIVMSINATPPAIGAIKAGALTATYDPRSAEAGALAISALALVLKEHKPISAMPKKIVVPTKRWDSSNVSSYVPPDARSVKLTSAP